MRGGKKEGTHSSGPSAIGPWQWPAILNASWFCCGAVTRAMHAASNSTFGTVNDVHAGAAYAEGGERVVTGGAGWMNRQRLPYGQMPEVVYLSHHLVLYLWFVRCWVLEQDGADYSLDRVRGELTARAAVLALRGRTCSSPRTSTSGPPATPDT